MSSKFHHRSHFETDPPAHGGSEEATVETGEAMEASHGDISAPDHVQEKTPVAASLTKRQKLRRHCWRFKWWYLAANIVFLAILRRCSFLVILPAIVQRIVDNQSLPINGGAFISLSPTEAKVSLDTSLDTPLPADLDPVTLLLYNKETPDFSPFFNITLPQQHVDGETTVSVANQTVTITNETELIYWFDRYFDQPRVALSTRGDAAVHLGALHSNAHVEKTVEVASLNSLSGFGVLDLQLQLPPLPNGNNVNGTVNLPNSGALMLNFGNITLNLWSGNIRLGLITVYDVSLPGSSNNTKNFDGQLFLSELVKNFGDLLDSQASALSNGNIQIDVTGNATIVNGQHIPYIEAVLNNRRLTSYMSITKLLGDVIKSFTGGGSMSLPDLLGEVFGNSSLIEQALDHWKGSRDKAARSERSTDRRLALSRQLLKLGMKMGTAN